MKKPAHIQIGESSTLCKLPLAKHHGCYCSYPSVAEAKEAAKVLRPHFKKGRVMVVAGECPNYSQGA